MGNGIYIDILFITNTLIGYFILRACAALCDEKRDIVRFVIASCLAGFSSFVILLDINSAILLWIYKLFTAAIICIITINSIKLRRLIKFTIWYIVLNLLLAGIVFGIMYYIYPRGIILNNFTIYFNVSPITLLLSVLIMYLIIKVLTLFFTKPQEHLLADISFSCDNTIINCRALVDSGFNVRDTLCELSPFLVSLPDVRAAMPIKIINGIDAFNGKKDAEFITCIYPICVQTANGTQALPSVNVDNFTVKINGKSAVLNGCAAMFTGEILGDGSFNAIIGMKLAKEVM
ncbi:MAG: sigma-E processing peptidase SpoIIGA [Oscillospiraceae bacterium]